MHEATNGLLTVFIALVTGIIGGELAMRCRLPAVVGQILGGVVIGGSALNLIPKEGNSLLVVLGELGAAFLLFAVGIETPVQKIGKVGKEALIVATLGVIFPFIFGFGWAYFTGLKSVESAFVGAAFTATSAGITAKVLQELNVLDARYSQVILGAAIIDDVLAMLVLSVVSGLAKGDGFSWLSLVWVLVESILFIVAIGVVFRKIVSRNQKLLDKPMSPLSPWSLSIAMCVGVALLASYVGLAAIIGAFLVGMILAETEYREWLHEKLVDLNEFIVPFFFVVTGMSVDLAVFKNPASLLSLAIITVLAVVGKFLGGFLGASEHRRIIGVGMVPRGEVGVVVAGLGKAFGVFSPSTYSLLVAMSLITSIIAAPVLGSLVRKREAV
jgi:Kef-type K+ transport system membrane component KefB